MKKVRTFVQNLVTKDARMKVRMKAMGRHRPGREKKFRKSNN